MLQFFRYYSILDICTCDDLNLTSVYIALALLVIVMDRKIMLSNICNNKYFSHIVSG